jgi:hypothetical protein
LWRIILAVPSLYNLKASNAEGIVSKIPGRTVALDFFVGLLGDFMRKQMGSVEPPECDI